MSTYYKFYCDKCGVSGGFFSRQMWGWGNFDIIDSFKFIAKHTNSCGAEALRIAEEQTGEYSFPEDSLLDTQDIIPQSNDWEFMRQNWTKGRSREDVHSAWLRRKGQQ